MLSLKNLVKIYNTKGGGEVRALDGVSIDFPATGMVFILGKSGSGKSTLLNVAGGLDVPTDGEIVVNGRSSKDFTAVDFDSYRNTCVGFIFQEYNLLPEFNVEQNLALALRLQNKPCGDKEVNDILEKVDLKGMGKRKPSTLSGGQKQRIAIARALIKDPDIIMADEPSGALDSATGEQIFGTLKTLSQTKLVIIVSHDRDFAERFGDRIIELKDGKVLSDTTKVLVKDQDADKNVRFIGDGIVAVKNAAELTESDIKEVFTRIKAAGGESVIAFGEQNLSAVKDAAGITDMGETQTFIETSAAPAPVSPAAEGAAFIKSRLPLSHAVKMGLGSLKVKPFRLIFTIFLSVLAFTMFGLFATLAAFDPDFSVARALETSYYDNIKMRKAYTLHFEQYRLNGENQKELVKSYATNYSSAFGEEEIKRLNEQAAGRGINFAGIMDFGATPVTGQLRPNATFSIRSNIYSSSFISDYYTETISGFSDCGEQFLKDNGMEIVAGAYPTAENQVLIPYYIYECFKKSGYMAYKNYGSAEHIEPSSPEDLVGQSLRFFYNDKNLNVEISGVVDTGDLSAFNVLKDPEDLASSQDVIGDMLEYENKHRIFDDYIINSFHTVLFVAPEFYQYALSELSLSSGSTYSEYTPRIQELKAEGAQMRLFNGLFDGEGAQYEDLDKTDKNNSFYAFSDMAVKGYPDAFSVFKLSEDRTSLTQLDSAAFAPQENEIYLNVTSSELRNLANDIGEHYTKLGKNMLLEYPEYTLALLHLLYYDYTTLPDTGFTEEMPNPYYHKPITEEEINAIWEVIYNEVYSDEGDDFLGRAYYRAALSAARGENWYGKEKDFKIAGFFFINSADYSASMYELLMPLSAINELNASGEQLYQSVLEVSTLYKPEENSKKYNRILTLADKSRDQSYYFLDMHGDDVEYTMTNLVYDNAQGVVNMINELKTTFLIIGVAMGVLSSLMLLNFISVSISYRKKEIGVLRAVGARGLDVFKIFFSEGGFIALICFVLSTVASFILCGVINSEALETTIALELLNFGILQIAVIFCISVLVSLAATALPVYLAAKKPPVESIREL